MGGPRHVNADRRNDITIRLLLWGMAEEILKPKVTFDIGIGMRYLLAHTVLVSGGLNLLGLYAQFDQQ
jgi:hypothetical protein